MRKRLLYYLSLSGPFQCGYSEISSACLRQQHIPEGFTKSCKLFPGHSVCLIFRALKQCSILFYVKTVSCSDAFMLLEDIYESDHPVFCKWPVQNPASVKLWVYISAHTMSNLYVWRSCLLKMYIQVLEPHAAIHKLRMLELI